jgi:hypothetical protein
MHSTINRRTLLSAAALAAGGAYAGLALAAADFEQDLLTERNTGIFAQIVIYDVIPGREAEFEKLVALPPQRSATGFVNDRVLRNIDPVTAQYATYTKYRNPAMAQAAIAARVAAVRALLRRDPESHLSQLDRVYTAAGEKAGPDGLELGARNVGQIAHLGLFLPSPTRTPDYYKSLYEVKSHTVRRAPRGYIGDELLIETERNAPHVQAPYSPRPREATRLSFNYGEYQTLEDAEDSYVDRGQARTPDLVTLERTFYSALQLPNRFYIFKVIRNT